MEVREAISILNFMNWLRIKIYIPWEYKQNLAKRPVPVLNESLIKHRQAIFLTIQFSQQIPYT